MGEAVPSSRLKVKYEPTAVLINTTVTRRHSAAQGTTWSAGSFWRQQGIAYIEHNTKPPYSLLQVQN